MYTAYVYLFMFTLYLPFGEGIWINANIKENQTMNLIPEEIKEYLEYNELTGIIIWIKSPANHVKINSEAGSVYTTQQGKQYMKIMFKRKSYHAHRIAYYLKTGNQTKHTIDHRNGDGLNNKWINIREATNGENAANTKKSINNTSGFKGVSWHKRSNKWMARITKDRKDYILGYYTDPIEAHKVYCEYANNLHKEFANFG